MSDQQTQLDRRPVLGCIADDVTGATDLATNLTQGGMRVVQVMGVPAKEDVAGLEDVDAVVVALKSRSIDKADAIDQSLAALRWLAGLGASRFYFKYCSTFDSTDQGNIGPVAEALMDELGVKQTIFCPAFPGAGRTVYQGHLFVGDKLLSESGLQDHPLNPMTDSNLLRVLGRQSKRSVGLLSHESIGESSQACLEKMSELADEGVSFVVTDCCHDDHLATLAEAVAAMPLITGGSGLARYLPSAYRSAGVLAVGESKTCLPTAKGRKLILAGSCSPATQGQVKWMRGRCEIWSVDVEALMENPAAEFDRVIAWATATKPDDTLLVTSTSSPQQVVTLQQQYGSGQVANAIEKLLACVAKTLVSDLGFRQLVLAGGETSGAIVRELGIQKLRIGPEICAGVPWTETVGVEPGLALALKSGNFGGENFFAVALEMLA
ncbi:hypothetical protein LF1_27190 [Rubripirellula obstinata]|uniref:3-oxo-tetronate kinase n=1 Tax=Rubripirellula obstinata TaxID=406547 RepID=A0A5B1CKW7_9BACT|nr:3-oxo-tetronate kinase [Rubripirellula obstinata]KAA1260180.1 hypothetical protein LF1_27190 [Rubripirellula obstinata]